MESGQEFRPYIPPDQDVPEFTPKAILLGVFFGILFGAATVYLALRAGWLGCNGNFQCAELPVRRGGADRLSGQCKSHRGAR